MAKIKLRGYRDYGIEGTMRAFAHTIEGRELIPKIEYLTLRRYEKDYLLRSDIIYVNKFDSLVRHVRAKLTAPPSVQLLENYSDTFHKLVQISDSIGLETQANLKGRLDKLTKQLISEIEERDKIADKDTYQSYRQGLILFSVGIIGSAILCLSLIILIAKRL